MLVFGISNKIGKDLGLFFYEFDNIEQYLVFDEANYLSSVFDIDIFVIQSSNNSYHFISFDILTRKKIIQIQRYTTLESDYFLMNEQILAGNIYGSCVLRIGEKGKKAKPQFIKIFLSEHNNHNFSINHFNFYSTCLNMYSEFCKFYINIKNKKIIRNDVYFDIYKTGIGARRKKFKGV